MKRLLAIAAALLLVALLVPTVSATTTWTARMGSYGVAALRVGSPDKLSIGAKSFRARTMYTVTLRRGSCATVGTLVYSARFTTSSTGTLARTISLTSAQTRAAKLPLAIRIGSRCGAFGAAVPVPTPTPTPTPGTFTDGMRIVGPGGIVPGTYASAGSATCYWARLSGFGGTLDEIITNHFGPGSQIVTIAPTDAGFSSSGCGTWSLMANLPTPVPTPAPCGPLSLCMGQSISFGFYSMTVNGISQWPGSPALEPGHVYVTLDVSVVVTAFVQAPPTFAIRGPSNFPYAGPVANGRAPVLKMPTSGTLPATTQGYVTFDVLASDVAQLNVTINGSAVVQLQP